MRKRSQGFRAERRGQTSDEKTATGDRLPMNQQASPEGRGLYHRWFCAVVAGRKGGSCRYRSPNLNERTRNVYENKEPAKRINHPWPFLIQGGEPQTTLLRCGGGRGWWGFASLEFFVPWRETGFVTLKRFVTLRLSTSRLEFNGTKRECL